jgi:hypothetical protein
LKLIALTVQAIQLLQDESGCSVTGFVQYCSVSVQTAQSAASAGQQLRDVSHGVCNHPLQAQEAHQVRDFRTVSLFLGLRLYYNILSFLFAQGTPAFMSSRVLRVKRGVEYRHTFLDDLESFFWVIFLCAAAHLDGDDAKPTEDAQRVLSLVHQYDLSSLGEWKSSMLLDCLKLSGADMRDLLKSFGNTWASDPIFVNMILHFGAYLVRISLDIGDPSNSSPTIVFSTVVDIVLSQLK